MTSFVLPYPPSLNRYWRHPNKGALAGRTLLSEEGRMYRLAVQKAVMMQRVRAIKGRLGVHIIADMPDRRARDLDNLNKGVLDGLTHAHVWVDDSVIDDLRITRGAIVPGGQLRITITVLADEPEQGTLRELEEV